MLTHFGTLFVLCRNYDYLTHLLTRFNTFNTPLTLLNFHKNDVLNVSRETVVTNCFTWNKLLTSINFIH